MDNCEKSTKEELILKIQELESANKELQRINEELTININKEDLLLSQTRENYETFFNTIDDFLFVLDEQANILHTNDTVLNRLGYTKEELIGQSVLSVHPVERREEAATIVEQMLQGKADFCPVPIITKDNVQIPVETRVKAGMWNKKPVIFGVTKDISRLQLSEEKFSKVFILNPSACGFSDFETGKYVEVNEAFYKLLGFEENEVLGKTAVELKIFTQEIRNFIASKADSKGKITNVECSLKAKNGDVKHVLLSAENIFVQNKQYRFTVVNDITRIKQIKVELEIAKKRAEENDRLKSAFLANMSHEIRTPMNGILGFAEILKKPNLSGEEQQDYIRIIEKSGLRMLNIINDIIDISKIESGQVDIKISESNINKQIEYLYTFFKPEVEAKGIQLTYKITLENNEAIIQTDREKIYSILTNLVKNSIKYCNTGTIEFGYTLQGEFIEFFVKDTGIGISDNLKDRVFERFIRTDNNSYIGVQGSGLGLAITKAYVEMLGGKIWFTSQEGNGTAFYFTIPYIKTVSDDNAIMDNCLNLNTIDAKLKILIAEDDKTSELLISALVKDFSKEILCVKNGIEAIETCQNNSDIDLILMDINMPIKNGFEATKEIRKFNKDVVIIAQTAYGLAGDKENSIKAGCNDYISKPINNDHFIALVQKYFNKQ